MADLKVDYQLLDSIERSLTTRHSEFQNIQVNTIDGQPTSLAAFAGKVLLVVNVASKCGFTPQYEGLEALYKAYKDQGFEVLGFPANDFGAQEPGTEAEIKAFCTTKYGVKFDMFAKVKVKGPGIDPLFQYLTSTETNPQFGGDIKWNFNKFLVDRNGNLIASYNSKTTPDDSQVKNEIEKALDAKPAK